MKKKQNDPTDDELLGSYMWGFNDELDGKEKQVLIDVQMNRAYKIGREDAIIGDDISSSDKQSNEEILKIIKNMNWMDMKDDNYVKYVLMKDLPSCPKGRIFKQDSMGGFFHSMTDEEAVEGKLRMYMFKKEEVLNHPEWFTKYNNSKPIMSVNFRISVDETQTQRFTEDEVMELFRNNEVRLESRLIARKSDGKIVGEILTTK